MMKMKWISCALLVNTCLPITIQAADIQPTKYIEKNNGLVSFDVSMPIDATGYTLHGQNLKGGTITFTDQGNYITPLLAHELGEFQLPIVISKKNKPLIKTNIKYEAIKFLNPNGIDNLFIKVGMANRTQKVAGLDPFVLKDGTYTWQVPIFAFGKEKNDLQGKSENWQMIQVGTGHGSSHHNGMYTLEFYLYTKGNGDTSISGHPQRTSQALAFLPASNTTHFNCHAEGMWGGGGSDPYRTIVGRCHGSTITFPAGPNLDYEYGTIELPTILSPWTAAPNDHCIVNGKPGKGCTNIKVASKFHYIAQKIRVPLKNGVTLTASAGTLYRQLNVHNLRYQCKDNVYLKNILPQQDCLKKSYVPGGWSAPYFSVGYEFKAGNGKRYVAKYIFTPERENSNRLAWRDASATRIYLTAISGTQNSDSLNKELKTHLDEALKTIKEYPAIYNVLGKDFFIPVLEKTKTLK